MPVETKLRVIKEWLKKKSGWYSMVYNNLRKSLLPFVMEMNKGNTGLNPYSKESQLAIFQNLLINKNRLAYYIRKQHENIGDGSEDWHKINESYQNIKGIVDDLTNGKVSEANNKIERMKIFLVIFL